MLECRQVIIVGAGPVGLLTALELAQQGIEVALMDAEDAASRPSNSASCHSISQTVLASIAGSAEVAEIILPVAGADHFEGSVNLRLDDLMDLLHRQLARHGNVELLWDHTVKALAQSGDKARVAVETEEGEVWFEADWIIGTDGARSTVRTQLGLTFDGVSESYRLVSATVDYPFEDFGFGDVMLLPDPVNWAMVRCLPQPGCFCVSYGENADLPERGAAERAGQRLAAWLPDGAIPCTIAECTTSRVEERCAPSFRIGNVLLAGDAAHVCNPVGDAGLTAAMDDALALARTLSAVIAGQAGDEELDRYAAERRDSFLNDTLPRSRQLQQRLIAPAPASSPG